MDKDSPFNALPDENVIDRRIGLRDINIYFCELCYHLWKSPNAASCLLCRSKNGVKLIHSYTTNYVRV